MKAFTTLSAGLGSILVGWILPMVAPSLPSSIKIVGLGLGSILILASAAMGARKARNEQGSSSINVSMGDGNKIDHIGNKHE